MRLKVIQINTYKGRYLESLASFLKMQNADIVLAQEVSSGAANLGGDKSNLFEVLKGEIGYDGIFYASVTIIDKINSFEGNAIFTCHKILESKFVPLNRQAGMTFENYSNRDFFPNFPRSIVEARIEFNDREIIALSCHGAWTAPPEDTEENYRQAKLIAKHLKSLSLPFIMGADMNMPLETRVIKTIEKSAKNLIANSKILQTTHPIVHKIVPLGYLVDYIFTSDSLKKISIEAPNVLVSDHLPLVAEVELRD